jgi:hypothetical protein
MSADEWSSMYLGRAGEHLVAAHLFRIGLNAATPPVDAGVDLRARKEFRTSESSDTPEDIIYQFQVKTTQRDSYNARLTVNQVRMFWEKIINLVVVFWAENTAPSVVVLPPSLLFMLSSGGFGDQKAPLRMKNGFFSLRFIKKNQRYFMRNLKHEITAMLNRFDRLEPLGADPMALPPYAHWADDRKALVGFDEDDA